MKKLGYLIWIIAFLGLAACTASIHNYSARPPLAVGARWVVMPFANHTVVPYTGESAASITTGVLRSHGFAVVNYLMPPPVSPFVRINYYYHEKIRMILWARRNGIHYLMTGDVNEWRYKVGLDGEPVVGVALTLVNVDTGQVIWSAVGSASGGSRVAVTTVAQNLIQNLLYGL